MSDTDTLTAVIVEDDPETRHVLVEVFEGAGFSTISVGNGLDGVHAVVTYQPFITTLDVNMPGIDGFEAARRIRAQSDTLIIMLTGLGDEADAVMGLSSGADEFLTKPFRPRELRARIEALMRRAKRGTGEVMPPLLSVAPARDEVVSWDHPAPPDAAVDASGGTTVTVVAPAESGEQTGWLRHRDLRLDSDMHVVLRGDDELSLTPTEFDLLAALLESKRRVRSKADLTLVLRRESYVTSYFVGEADKRAIEAHMTNLRRKLGDDATKPTYIETVRGVGYRLTPDEPAR